MTASTMRAIPRTAMTCAGILGFLGILVAGVLLLAAVTRPAGAQPDRPRRAGAEEDPKKWVTQKWTVLDTGDVPGRYMLMEVARDYGMLETMRALAREILSIDPGHRAAHRHLNHTLHKGKWIQPEEAEAQGLLRFDYTFPPDYRSPLKDRLLFPLYFDRKDFKQHTKHQEWVDPWVLKRKPLTIRSNCTRAKVERFVETFKTFAEYVTDYLGLRLKSNYEINIYLNRIKDNKFRMLPDGDARKREEMQRIFAKTFFNPRQGATWEEFQERFWQYAARMKEEVGAPDFSRAYRRRMGFGN